MLFDTHCHLNFKTFNGKLKKVITSAKKAGVEYLVVPGTDIETSKKALGIAKKYDHIYAAVGIHPHHLFPLQNSKSKIPNDSLKLKINQTLKEIESLLPFKKVVAVGEIGLDRYIYQKTKYSNYQINNDFIDLQKIFFLEQLKLAKKYQKAVIIHNRLATQDLLNILASDKFTLSNIKMVFHCCQPDNDLLDFAIKHKILIGVDGDVCYSKKKQDFVKKVPFELLVLETDAPFLSPLKETPNEPRNLPLIVKQLAKILNKKEEEIKDITTKNAKKLFRL